MSSKSGFLDGEQPNAELKRTSYLDIVRENIKAKVLQTDLASSVVSRNCRWRAGARY